MSWSVRGVENDARETALDAAREAGVPVGEWLNGLIRQSASTPGHAHAQNHGLGHKMGRETGMQRHDTSLESLQQRVERLSNSTTAATPRHTANAASHGGGDADQITEIARALDELLGDNRAANARPQREIRETARSAARREAAPHEHGNNDPARAKRVERVLATLDNLDRRVRTLSGNDEAPRNAPPAPRPASQFAEPAATRAASQPAKKRQRSLQSAIEEISARKDDLRAAPQRMASPAPRNTAPARQQASGNVDRHFDTLAGQIDSFRDPHDQQNPELGHLRQEMADLRNAIVSQERDGTSQRDLNDMNRIADMIDRLQQQPSDGRVIAGLRAEISELREAVIGSNIGGTLKTLEHGYAHIVQRLDELRRLVGDPRILEGLDDRLAEIENALASFPQLNEFNAMEDRLRDLSNRIEDAANRGGGADIVHLENEMQALRRMISELDVRDIVRSVDDRLRGLGDRIDEMENSVVRAGDVAGDVGGRIAAMEERLPDTDAFDRLNHRLERIVTMLSEDRAAPKSDTVDARLSEIIGRLDNIERNPAPESKYDTVLSLLERRIDALTAKLEELDANPLGSGALDAAVQRIDAALERTTGSHRFEDLQAQISELSSRFDAGALSGSEGGDFTSLRDDVAELRRDLMQPERLAAILEPQIQELARSLMSGDRVTTDDASLARIEQQIAVIAGQLDATEDRLSGLSDIEAALGKIGGALSGGTERAAPHTGRNDDVAALRNDLSRLMQVAGAGTLDADAGVSEIQSAMNAIVARLSSLETDAMEVRGHAEFAVGGQVAMAALAVAAGGGGGRVAMPRMPVDALEKALAENAPSVPVDRPLEPGSGKPDLAALLREHSDRGEPRPSGEGAGARDRKADFIAAARRAAQAAAAEVAAEEIGSSPIDDASTEGRGNWLRNRLKGKSRDTKENIGAEPVADDPDAAKIATDTQADERPAGRLRRALRSRRPIVLAAAAVILAIGALKMASTDNLERVASFVAKPMSLLTTTESIDGQRYSGAAMTPRDSDLMPATVTGSPEIPPGARQIGASADMPDKAVTFEPPSTIPGQFNDTPRFSAPESFQSTAAAGGEIVVANMTPPTTPPVQALPSIDAPIQAPVQQTMPRIDAPTEVMPQASLQAMPQTARPEPLVAPVPTLEREVGLSAPMPEDAVGPMSLRMAAANGNPRAQFEIAARYTEGRGVFADATKAAEWYLRAAEGGLAPAQYSLGSLYEKGRGVSRDPATARIWYKRAADQGNAKAMHNLAVLYAEGGVGSPDFATATRWFKKASQLGVRDSQYNLGILYARGFGVDKDLIESYRWFALAALQGDNDSATKRDEIANTLNPQDFAAAQLLVSTWQADPLDEAANAVTLDPVWTNEPARNTSAVSEELVLQSQLLLGELGYDTGPADGMIGPKTREAVRAFQHSAGLPVTGKIDRKLIQVLGSRAI